MDSPSLTPPVCSYEGSDYQDSFWGQGQRAYEDSCEALALKRLLPKTGRLMLELGAGAGRNTPRYTMFDRVVLVDYSRTQLEQAIARLGKANRYIFVSADVYRLPFVDALFDGATMIRTLHHMAEPQLAINSIQKALSSEASFILEYANKRNLKSILRWIIGKQAWNPFTLDPVEFASLNYDFHPKSIRKWLNNASFQVKQILTVSHFRLGLLKRHVPLKVLVGMDSLLQWSGAIAQFTPSVFIKAVNLSDSHRAVNNFFFACPQCKTGLPLVESDQTCPGCGSVWEFRDGIYDFRIPSS